MPLARMFADPPILAVKKSSPWNTLQDFITAVRNNPGQIPYGTSGYLGTVHLAMEMFLNAAGLKMVHVPYQGGGPAFAALLSDQVPVVPTLESIGKGSSMPGISACWRNGAPSGSQFSERADAAGSRLSRRGLHPVDRVFAPKKTPEHVTRTLRDTIRPFMQDKAVVARFLTAGSQVSYLDGPEFARFLEGDTDRLVKIVRKIGLS